MTDATDGLTRPAHDPLAKALETIATRDPVVRAFCTVRQDAGNDVTVAGPLSGLTFAIKEIFDVAGCECGWGSPIHTGRIPQTDAAVVADIRRGGGLILGTTASTEYAMARAAPTTNPHDPTRSPGASSSGSAAAVAAGMADLALGSQTIGSGIRPAAYCGVYGFKPTKDAISLKGAMPLSKTLDHAVIFAGDMDHLHRAAHVLAPGIEWNAGQSANPNVGLVSPWFPDPVDPRLWKMVRDYAAGLADGALKPLSLPTSVADAERDCVETILATDMWRHHHGDFERAAGSMSDDLKTWLIRGKATSADDLAAARKTSEGIKADVGATLATYDLIITVPTTGVAPRREDGTGARAPQRIWTLLGWPALSVPIGTLDGLPVAAQVIAQKGRDAQLLAAVASAPGIY